MTEQPRIFPETQPAYKADDEVRTKLMKNLFPNYPDQVEIARFFEVLGRAITVWQLVETALYELYELIIAPGNSRACSASFHAIQTFNGKLVATDAAVTCSLMGSPEALDQWRKLQKQANEIAKRRNQFVHFSTFIVTDSNTNERVRLEPPIHDGRFVDDDRPKLRLSEIAEITDRFVALANNLDQFKGQAASLRPSDSR